MHRIFLVALCLCRVVVVVVVVLAVRLIINELFGCSARWVQAKIHLFFKNCLLRLENRAVHYMFVSKSKLWASDWTQTFSLLFCVFDFGVDFSVLNILGLWSETKKIHTIFKWLSNWLLFFSSPSLHFSFARDSGSPCVCARVFAQYIVPFN